MPESKKTFSPSDSEISQEKQAVLRLIQAGNANKDKETVKIAQARLRILEGRPTPEDLEMFHLG